MRFTTVGFWSAKPDAEVTAMSRTRRGDEWRRRGMAANGEAERPAAGARMATTAHNLPAPAAPNRKRIPARSSDC
jgi:hypothetical protein